MLHPIAICGAWSKPIALNVSRMIHFFRTISASSDYQINRRRISLFLRDTRRCDPLFPRDSLLLRAIYKVVCQANSRKFATSLETIWIVRKYHHVAGSSRRGIVEETDLKGRVVRGGNVPFSPSENDLSPVGYKMLFKIALRRHLLLRCSFTNFLSRVS